MPLFSKAQLPPRSTMEADVVDAVADLQRQKRAIDAALAVNRQELKRARWRQKDARRAEASVWRLTAFVSDIVLIIYVLTGYFLEPAIRFLRSVGQKHRWPQKSEDELGLIESKCFWRLNQMTSPRSLTRRPRPSLLRCVLRRSGCRNEFGSMGSAAERGQGCGSQYPGCPGES